MALSGVHIMRLAGVVRSAAAGVLVVLLLVASVAATALAEENAVPDDVRIAIVSPVDDETTQDRQPSIIVRLEGVVGGLEAEQFVLLVDGRQVEATVSVGAATAIIRPKAPLALGSHGIEVVFRSDSGREVRAVVRFNVRSVQPPASVGTFRLSGANVARVSQSGDTYVDDEMSLIGEGQLGQGRVGVGALLKVAGTPEGYAVGVGNKYLSLKRYLIEYRTSGWKADAGIISTPDKFSLAMQKKDVEGLSAESQGGVLGLVGRQFDGDLLGAHVPVWGSLYAGGYLKIGSDGSRQGVAGVKGDMAGGSVQWEADVAPGKAGSFLEYAFRVDAKSQLPTALWSGYLQRVSTEFQSFNDQLARDAQTIYTRLLLTEPEIGVEFKHTNAISTDASVTQMAVGYSPTVLGTGLDFGTTVTQSAVGGEPSLQKREVSVGVIRPFRILGQTLTLSGGWETSLQGGRTGTARGQQWNGRVVWNLPGLNLDATVERDLAWPLVDVENRNDTYKLVLTKEIRELNTRFNATLTAAERESARVGGARVILHDGSWVLQGVTSITPLHRLEWEIKREYEGAETWTAWTAKPMKGTLRWVWEF